MADFQTDFDYAENNSLEIVPYQFESLLQNDSGNTTTSFTTTKIVFYKKLCQGGTFKLIFI